MNKKFKRYIAIVAIAVLSLSTGWVVAASHQNHVEKLGTTYPIIEANAIEEIHARLLEKQESGQLAQLQDQLQESLNHAALNLEPVAGLSPVNKPTVRFFEPSYTLPNNILNHDDSIIAMAGTVIKPLEIAPIPFAVFFFDGREENQIKLALEMQQKYGERFMPILTAGSWYDLSERLNQAVYYDQQGKLSFSMQVYEIPALVQQENHLLRIETFKP